jgi:hypothetical protein
MTWILSISLTTSVPNYLAFVTILIENGQKHALNLVVINLVVCSYINDHGVK